VCSSDLAELLTRKGTHLKRFGFVTTNSLSQIFQRRVMEKYLNAKNPVSLLMAIPDHPWTKATRDAAAVRIAMTVAASGKHDGRLFEVTKEEGLDSDAPNIQLMEAVGKINSDLTTGTDVTRAFPLLANAFLCFRGITFMGDGFILREKDAKHFRSLGPEYEAVLKRYISGRDLVSRERGVWAIDLFDYTIDVVRLNLAHIYQHLLETVKPVRDKDNRASYREKWWVFAEPRTEFRKSVRNLPRYIATSQTAKHRIFQFLDPELLPDQTLVLVASDDTALFGILSSKIHKTWAFALGGWLGIGNDHRYSNSRTFACFPFPTLTERQSEKLGSVAMEMHTLRKQCQADHPGLTLTQIYNVREKLRAGEPLNDSEEAIKTKGLVLIVNELHDKIDALVAQAYGWPADLSDEDILARLVALNAQRAAEEKRGLVRWLRPDYQRARAGVADAQAAAESGAQIAAPLVLEAGKTQKPSFPSSEVERTAAVFAALAMATKPLDAASIARMYRQGARAEPAVLRVLAALARLGHIHSADGKSFALRRAA
jgi:hypothetical protein